MGALRVCHGLYSGLADCRGLSRIRIIMDYGGLSRTSELSWNMYGICMEYVWNMHGIYMEIAWNMQARCMEYVWNMYGICREYAWDTYGI